MNGEIFVASLQICIEFDRRELAFAAQHHRFKTKTPADVVNLGEIGIVDDTCLNAMSGACVAEIAIELRYFSRVRGQSRSAHRGDAKRVRHDFV